MDAAQNSKQLISIAISAAVLGAVFSTSALHVSPSSFFDNPLALYGVLFSFFHFLEFTMTAFYHANETTFEAFLLDHSKSYWIAVLLTLLEYQLRPDWNLHHSSIVAIGLVIAVAGQIVRTKAMADAGTAFTHLVATERQSNHRLVRSGLYARMRHPSYVGFYLWTIGNQVMMGNVLTLLLCLVVMHWFFKERIRDEETHLLVFFGNEYLEYRRSVPSGLPFVS